MEVRKVGPPYIQTSRVEGTYFAFSINDYWACCIREWVQLVFPVLSHVGCWLTVILTLRTWAVWNRHQRLSIILPIFYSLFVGSCFVIIIQVGNSVTCKWNFHARSWWMIYCMVDGPLPHPGFKGCFIHTVTNQNFVFLWVLLLVFDARKCKYIIKWPSSD